MQLLSQEDLSFYLGQNSENLQIMLSQMASLMTDSNIALETLEHQGWWKRLCYTVSGKNSLTKAEIKKNHDKLNSHLVLVVKELFDRSLLNDHQIMHLASRIEELYNKGTVLNEKILGTKEMLGQFVKKLNDKINRNDNFQLLVDKVGYGGFKDYPPLVAVCLALSEMDVFSLNDPKKTGNLRLALEHAKILSQQVSLSEVSRSLDGVTGTVAATVYLEVQAKKGYVVAEVAKKAIENYHFLPTSNSSPKIQSKAMDVEILQHGLGYEGKIPMDLIFDDLLDMKINGPKPMKETEVWMFMSDYKNLKEQALASYKQVANLIYEVERFSNLQGVNLPTKTKELLEGIKEKKKQIEADQFVLMVAGEAKSGKSTFINAFLGENILPMDVKQCTSAIVEIKQGPEFSVWATYADPKSVKQVFKGEAARKFLKENAAIDDAYRDIPAHALNEKVVHQMIEKGRSGKSVTLHGKELEDILNSPEIKAANIHNLPLADYEKKIKGFLEEKSRKWKEIIQKIEVTYPFAEELKGIHIVDSPGVCARGGVSEVTDDYIKKANAVIFLKTIAGQALESTQFNNFYETVSRRLETKALFLGLTRCATVSEGDLERLKEAANKIFSKIDKNQLLFVDSKIELTRQYLTNEGTRDDVIIEKFKKLKSNDQLEPAVFDIWGKTNDRLMGDGTGVAGFLTQLSEKSNFIAAKQSIEKFGRKAHYLQLISFIKELGNLVQSVQGSLKANLEFLEIEDSTKLSAKINVTKGELDNLNTKLAKGVNEVVRRFNASGGVIDIEAGKLEADFKGKLNSTHQVSLIKRMVQDKMVEVQQLQQKLSQQILTDFNKQLIQLSEGNILSYEAIQPQISEAELDGLFNNLKEKAYDVKQIEEGITFQKSKTVSHYSNDKHIRLYKESISEKFDDKVTTLKKPLSDHVVALSAKFAEELKANAEVKKKELDDIFNKRDENEKRKNASDFINQWLKKAESYNVQNKTLEQGVRAHAR